MIFKKNELSDIQLTSESIIALLTIGYFFSIFLIVIHDLILLSLLQLSFSSSPTTIADHLKSGLSWLPLLIVATLFGQFFPEVFDAAKKFSPRQPREHESNREIDQKESDSYSEILINGYAEKISLAICILAFIIFIALYTFVNVTVTELLIISAGALTFYVCVIFAKAAHVYRISSFKKTLRLSLVLISLIAFSGVTAFTDAKSIVKFDSPSIIVTTSNAEIEVKLVLSGSNGVLAYSKNGRTHLYPWASIHEIRGPEVSKIIR